MSKRVVCESRDARKFCEGSDKSHGEPWWTLCKKILDDPNAWQQSENEPMFFSERMSYVEWGREYWMAAEFWIFKNRVFIEKHDNDYSFDQRKLLIMEEFDKERREFEKLDAKFAGIPTTTQLRSKIPSNVRIFVWQRDGGRCVECGSNENLEYDHIIPFAKGGSNTERNLQLLCGNCNRLKSDKIQ